LHVHIILILARASLHEKIYLYVVYIKNNKISKKKKYTTMLSFLLFEEMQISILPFSVGHIWSYLNLKIYTNT
jgi:hypothetical protein